MIALVLLNVALTVTPARPLEWPAIASFLVAARFEEELTVAQRLLLERQQLNEIKERFRVVGRYPAPILERRLPSALLVARDGDCVCGCVGIEAAVVDCARSYAVRRSSAEAVVRRALPTMPTPSLPSSPPSFGRTFHRQLTPGEADEEMEVLRVQEEMLDDEDGFAVVAAELRRELDSARLPRGMTMSPLLSTFGVSISCRRTGVGRRLLEAAEMEVAGWRYGGILAMVDEDNVAARGFFDSAGWRVAFRDEGAQATRPELPSPMFNRRELELIRVPMPQLGYVMKTCGSRPETSGDAADWSDWVGLVR